MGDGPRRPAGQRLEDGQGEGCGLAGARRRLAQQVAPGEHGGDGLALDGRGLLVAQAGQAVEQLGAQPQAGEGGARGRRRSSPSGAAAGPSSVRRWPEGSAASPEEGRPRSRARGSRARRWCGGGRPPPRRGPVRRPVPGAGGRRRGRARRRRRRGRRPARRCAGRWPRPGSGRGPRMRRPPRRPPPPRPPPRVLLLDVVGRVDVGIAVGLLGPRRGVGRRCLPRRPLGVRGRDVARRSGRRRPRGHRPSDRGGGGRW